MNTKSVKKIIVFAVLCLGGTVVNASAQDTLKNSNSDASFLDEINFDNASTPDKPKKKDKDTTATPVVETTPQNQTVPATSTDNDAAAVKETPANVEKGKKSKKKEEPVVTTPVTESSTVATPVTTPTTEPVTESSVVKDSSAAVLQPVNSESTTPVVENNIVADTTKPVSAYTPAQSRIDDTEGQEESTIKKTKKRTFVGGKKFNRFSLGANVGMTRVGNGLGVADFANNDMVPGFEIAGTYWLGRAMALQAKVGLPAASSLTGNSLSYLDSSSAFKYKTTVAFDYSLNLVFSIGNISFLNKKPNLGFYASIGLGGVQYDSDTTNALVGGAGAIQGRTDLILPIGLGVKYKINDQLTASAGYTVKYVASDRFDNAVYRGTPDNYSTVNVGVAYTFGKKNQPSMEWGNPLAYLADDVTNNDKVTTLRKKMSALEGELDSLNQNVIGRLDSLTQDNDGDGILNMLDRQLDTPKGSSVDASGKALDSDNDGVIDLYDRCPFEKGLAMYEGCKKALTKGSASNKEKAEKLDSPSQPFTGSTDDLLKETNEQLLFDKNSYKLRPNAEIALERFAEAMKDSKIKFNIAGYTDSDGSEDLNQQISSQRAQAVKKYLISLGMKARRISTKGLSSSAPLAENMTSKGKQRNRAVVIEYRDKDNSSSDEDNSTEQE